MEPKPTIAAIVPAFNEERTIGDVVRALKACALITEVVVVSDGSTDGTADTARAAGADVVRQLPVRKGKGGAMQHGVALTDAEVLFFCDADLLHFKPENAEAIIRPVIEGTLAMSVGLRDRGEFMIWLEGRLPFIGGERAMRRSVFESIPDIFLKGFKVEAALNFYCRANGLPYGGVPSRGVSMVKKMQKVGFWKGLAEYVVMGYAIVHSMIDVRLHRKEFKQHFTHWKHTHPR
jgi:glycosyltransferase involved in cell wall biosynthesis